MDRRLVESSANIHQNLVNEINIQADVKSPNVVALFCATKTTEKYWLLMELCNGGDLANYMWQRGGYLPEPEARLILKQIVKGI